MPLIAIEEHWSMPEVTSALRAVPHSDESLVFHEAGDNRQRLEDLAAGRVAAMDAQGIDLSSSLSPRRGPIRCRRGRPWV